MAQNTQFNELYSDYNELYSDCKNCTAITIIVVILTENEQNTTNVFCRLPKNGDCWLYNYYKKKTIITKLGLCQKKGNFDTMNSIIIVFKGL